MEGLRVGARVVALGVGEPVLHLDTVTSLLEAAWEMLRVRDTVGVEDGHTLRVLTRVVALGDTVEERQREGDVVWDDDTVADTVLVAGHTGSRNAWMLMPYVAGRAAQDPPPLVDFQPPLPPSQVVENTPELLAWELVVSRDIVQEVVAKERAMA